MRKTSLSFLLLIASFFAFGMDFSNPFDNADFREQYQLVLKDLGYNFKTSKGLPFKKFAPRKVFITKLPLGYGSTSYIEELNGKLVYIAEWSVGDTIQAKKVFSNLDIGINRTASLNGYKLDYSKKHQDNPLYHFYKAEDIPRDMHPALKELVIEISKELITKAKKSTSIIKMKIQLGGEPRD